MYQCCEHVSMAAQKRTRSIADYFSASTKGPPVEKRPRGDFFVIYLPVYIEWLNHNVQRRRRDFLLVLWFTPMN